MTEKFDWRSTLREVVEERQRRLGPHPGHDVLAAYHAGNLGEEEAKALQDHLVLCPQCAKLLLDLDSFAVDAASPPSNAANPQHGGARRRGWQVPAAAAAIAAAVLLLTLAWPAPLPEYSLKLAGNVQLKRALDPGSDQGRFVYAQGSRLTLKLQPASASNILPTARAHLRRGQRLRALSASTLEIDSNGVVSLDGTVGADLLLPRGESELIVSVARPGALPSRDEISKGGNSSGWGWYAFGKKIEIVAPAVDAPLTTLQDPWVEYAGCWKILIGPICILDDDRSLTLWVRHRQESEIRIHAGGWRDSYDGAPVDEGFRYQIEVGDVQEVAVEVLQEGKRSIWALEVAHRQDPDLPGTARGLQGPDQARRLLMKQASALDPWEAGAAHSLLARSEDDPRRREEHYRKAISAHRETGFISDEIHDATGLSFYLIRERRFSEVAKVLDLLPVAATGGSSESRYFVAFYRGQLAEKRGDFRVAVGWMDQAARFAERGNMTKNWFLAIDTLAQQLSTAGLTNAADAIHSRMEPQMESLCGVGDEDSGLTPCDCARFAVNRAWGGLLALEAGRSVEGPDPSVLLEKAEGDFLAGQSSCLRTDDLPNVRLNRALAALHAGDLAQAGHHLRQAEFDPDAYPRGALWKLDIEARILLAGNQPDRALRFYEDLKARAEISSSPEAAWRAAFGSALALDRLGEDGKAVQSCNQASRLLDHESLLVPMHKGREVFIDQRERASRFCIDLLLRADRKEEALAELRRSAARVLRNLRAAAKIADLAATEQTQWEQARDTYSKTRSEIAVLAARIWKGLPADQELHIQEEIEGKRRALLSLLDRLASLEGSRGAPGLDLTLPSGGRLILAYHPLQQGWVAMAADENGVMLKRIAELPDNEDADGLSFQLVEPFAEKIRRASEIRVIPYGVLRGFDFHALPFGGGILLDQAPVVYHLDLPASDAQDRPPDSALVVSGAGLLEALHESRAVQSALESRSDVWPIELLDDPSATKILARLSDVTLFHFAGHAEYDEISRGWGSHLALSGGTRLTVDDILYAPRVPRWAVLSGCETSRDSRQAPLPSIGLAQAFLVAGAEAVLAATVEVSDRDAAELMESFYGHWDSSTSMAAALRKAQLDLKDTIPDWKKFRILAR